MQDITSPGTPRTSCAGLATLFHLAVPAALKGTWIEQMEIHRQGNLMKIDSGLFQPSYEIEVSKTVCWRFVAEKNGATYIAFQYPDATQHVSILRREPKRLLLILNQLSSELQMEPEIIVHESRISRAEMVLALDVLTLGTISAILGSAVLSGAS